MTGRIEHAVTLWEPWPSTWTYRATLAYDPADPYAVTLRFPSPSGRTDGIAYTFARELLVDAVELGQDAGHSDIRIYPSDGWVMVDLYPTDLYADGDREFPPLLMRHESAALFLSLTYAAVPVGTEAARINWDAELAGVLGGAR